MKVVVNSTDITELINISSYKIDVKKEYEEWLNGNYVKKRIYTRERVNGSFDVALYGKDDMTADTFKELWDGAVTNNVVTIRLYIPSYGEERLIQAYFDFTIKKHNKVREGQYVDIVTIKLEEC